MREVSKNVKAFLKTGEKVDVAEKKVAFFKTGKLLRDRLNRN